MTAPDRLAAGWVPSRNRERTWVRGHRYVRRGDDLTEVWDADTETEPMTEAEEVDLLGRTIHPDAGDPEAVQQANSKLGVPDG
jgi:hypothetical protein